MKSIPQRKDQAQKAFRGNFIKYLRRNFYQNFPENRGKGYTSQIILWPEIPQQAQKNYRPYHTPHKQRYRNPVQNSNEVNPTTNKKDYTPEPSIIYSKNIRLV